jgi:5-methylcytosine-specific restriction endonuclease McrA
MNTTKLKISDLRDKFSNGQINLDPPYQRRPVWRTKQRELLLSSLFNGIPVPALIFHVRFDKKKKKDIYDVLDGKQRIETILNFIEKKILKDEGKLKVSFKNPNTNKLDILEYKDLQNKKINEVYSQLLEKFWGYEIPVIEYSGDLEDFFGNNVAAMEVFVRINSTGSPLKKNEIRHAKNSGHFFDLGLKLERKYKKLFHNKWKIVSKRDIDRYILHEFILELCTSIYEEKITNKREKLEYVINKGIFKTKELNFINKRFNEIINWIKSIFPNEEINTTRFKNKSDFYSLFNVLYSLLMDNYVSVDKKANIIAGNFLKSFSYRLNKLDVNVKPYNNNNNKIRDNDKSDIDYLISTKHSTDNIKQRTIRHNYILSLLKDGFFIKKKDKKRNFSTNVKNILWFEATQKTSKPKCPRPFNYKNCKNFLTYDDSQIDHNFPWAKGGPTKLHNAQLLCSVCNKSKGRK